MEKTTTFWHLGTLLVIAILAVIVTPISGQSTSICTGAMIRSFTPCIGYLASGSNTSSPSSACCNSLRSLMSNGQDCLCLIITGGSSLQIPINQTLAMSLPRACRSSGVPIECKAVSSPAPAPDPGSQGRGGSSNRPANPGPTPAPGNQGQGGWNTPPGLVTPPSGGSIIPQTPSPPSSTPGGFVTPPAAQGDGVGGVVPNLAPPGMRPTLTQSAAHDKSHHAFPISLLVAVLGVIVVFNFY